MRGQKPLATDSKWDCFPRSHRLCNAREGFINLGTACEDMAKLSDAQVDRALKSLKGWKRDGEFIAKDFHFKAFLSGIRFVDAVARIAEKQEHHPDIHIIWTTVTLKIQT